MDYLKEHWNLLKHSFDIDSLTWKLLLTDIGFIFSLLLSYTLLYLFWAKNLLSLQNILEIAQTGQILGSTPGVSIVQLWNRVILNIVLVLVFTIIIYVLLISLYGALSHKFLSKKDFTIKLLLNFLSVNSILTVVYLLLLISVFCLSKNIKLAVWGIIVFTLLYLYALLIFYLVTKDDKLTKIFVHGFKSMVKLHYTLVPIILFIILMSLFSFIISIVSFGNTIVLTVLALIAFFYLITWIRKYLHHVIHD
jgi:hypothetical protein